MNKRTLILVMSTVLLVATSSAVTYAATVNLRWTKNIYNVSDVDDGTSSSTVSTFDEGGNRCYVVVNQSWNRNDHSIAPSISCVRMNR